MSPHDLWDSEVCRQFDIVQTSQTYLEHPGPVHIKNGLVVMTILVVLNGLDVKNVLVVMNVLVTSTHRCATYFITWVHGMWGNLVRPSETKCEQGMNTCELEPASSRMR